MVRRKEEESKIMRSVRQQFFTRRWLELFSNFPTRGKKECGSFAPMVERENHSKAMTIGSVFPVDKA